MENCSSECFVEGALLSLVQKCSCALCSNTVMKERVCTGNSKQKHVGISKGRKELRYPAEEQKEIERVSAHL